MRFARRFPYAARSNSALTVRYPLKGDGKIQGISHTL